MKRTKSETYFLNKIRTRKLFLMLGITFVLNLMCSVAYSATTVPQDENLDNTVAMQQQTVTGTVTDAVSGEALPGVNIVEKGTTNGTVTGIDGKYSITVSSAEAIIEFSFIGFLTEEQVVGGNTNIDITLVADLVGINEVVVVGYGVQKKSDVTGAMVSVSSDELTSRPVSNAYEALQGRAAGVDITSNERPGEIGKIKIRGTRSLTKSAKDPLYVVDGIPLNSASGIETLNPQDIESIDILKDASATAIYGSRGANGVILVSTKRGKVGKFSLNYAGSVTTEKIVDKGPMMNASDYITWRRWAHHNADPAAYPAGDQPTLTSDEAIFDPSADPIAWANIEKGWASGSWDGSKVTSTDWTDFVTQTGVTQNHVLSANGGTDKMQTYMSFGYLDQKGTMIGQGYKRYTSNLSVDIQPKEWFNLGGSINASWSDQDYGTSETGGSSSNSSKTIYEQAKRIYSHALPYDENGELIINPGGDVNVYTIIGEADKSVKKRQMFRAIGSFYGKIDFGEIVSPLEGLSYRVNFGPDFRHRREGIYVDAESVNRLGGTSYSKLENLRDFSWTLDNIVTYDKAINSHNFTVTLVQSAMSWNTEKSNMSGENIPKASYLWNNFGALDVTDPSSKVAVGSDITDRQLSSYMARLNYSFANKYLLTASGRWDGASQLSPDNKWSFFPSAALGWRITEESFMQNADFVDQLKLRLGFGSTGNAGVDPYSTLGSLKSYWVAYGGENNELAYAMNDPSYSAPKNYVSMPNEKLGWEVTTQYNLGLDFSFLRGRVGGAIDVYTSYTNDLLMKMTIPTVSGYKSTFANVGETSNKGIDITLNTVNINKSDFKWFMNINAAWQKDKIEVLANGKNDMIGNTWFIGESIDVLYDVEAEGLWKDEDADLMALYNANGHNFEVGQVKPIDQNNDTLINSEDRVVLGNKNPRWTIGFNNTFTYKGFELDILIYGRLGYTYDTKGEGQLGRYNQREIDYWRPDNTGAEYQKPERNESGGDTYASLLGYRSASFLKIRTISLAYNLPSSVTNKMKIANMKVYLQALNPATIYSSIDFLDMDTEKSYYNRGFVVGINVGF